MKVEPKSNMTVVPKGKGTFGHRNPDTGRRPHEDRGQIGRDTPPSHGPASTGLQQLPEAVRGEEGFSPGIFRESTALLTP